MTPYSMPYGAFYTLPAALFDDAGDVIGLHAATFTLTLRVSLLEAFVRG